MTALSTAYAATAAIERIRRDVCRVAFVFFFSDGAPASNVQQQQFQLLFLDEAGTAVLTKQGADMVFTAPNRLQITLTDADKAQLSAGRYQYALYNTTNQRTEVAGTFVWQRGRASAQGVFTPADFRVVYNVVTGQVTLGGMLFTGQPGARGYGPLLANVVSGERVVQQVVDWVGGEGPKPPTGSYVAPGGFTLSIDQATDVRGGRGWAAWEPVLANVADGQRIVMQVADWFEGEGPKPPTGQFIGPTGFVPTAAQATNLRGLNAWTPVLANVPDGQRIVQQIIDFVNGEGAKPAFVGQFLGPGGYVLTAAQATDVRGPVNSGLAPLVVAAAASYVVAGNAQVLMAVPIDVDGELMIEGALVSV